MQKHLSAVISALIVLVSAQAAAGNFTTADVKNFIKVSEEMKGLEGKYPELEDQMQQDFMRPDAFSRLLDENGNLSIFKRTMTKLPAGEARSEITSIVKRNGFSSLDGFASTADMIMMAYMALNMDAQDMGSMPPMDDATMAMMPASVREQMKGVQMLMTAVENVPADDRETLRPLMSEMDAAFEG